MQSEADWLWVDKNYYAVLDQFLPIKEQMGEPLGYRSHRDLYRSVLEYSFILSEDLREKRVYVLVRMPDGTSLYDQIMAMHRQSPDEDIESIKKKLKVKEWRSDDSQYPIIRVLYDKFYSLKLTMRSKKEKAEREKGNETFFLHPTIHTFRASVSGGGVIDLTLTDNTHPLVRWALEARREFNRCASWNESPANQ